MDSNTHSTGAPAGLGALAAAVDGLAAQDLDGLGDAVLAERVMALRGLMDRLERPLAGRAGRQWTPAAPPAPNKACRPAPPPGGCGPGCA